MEELEITWLRALKVWWSIVWRTLLYSLIISILVGIPIGIAAATLGLDQESAARLGRSLGSLLGLFIAVWVVKIVLGKSFSDFRIVLVPSDEARLQQMQVEDSHQLQS
jgi:ABC-type dipeptide/oligopeptide/nickel transport system permease component